MGPQGIPQTEAEIARGPGAASPAGQYLKNKQIKMGRQETKKWEENRKETSLKTGEEITLAKGVLWDKRSLVIDS